MPAWLPKLVGLTGLSLDFTFHWLQANDPLQIVFDGQMFTSPDPGFTLFVRILALGAHMMFIIAFFELIVTPFEPITIVPGKSFNPTRRLRRKAASYSGRLASFVRRTSSAKGNEAAQGPLRVS